MSKFACLCVCECLCVSVWGLGLFTDGMIHRRLSVNSPPFLDDSPKKAELDDSPTRRDDSPTRYRSIEMKRKLSYIVRERRVAGELNDYNDKLSQNI